MNFLNSILCKIQQFVWKCVDIQMSDTKNQQHLQAMTKKLCRCSIQRRRILIWRTKYQRRSIQRRCHTQKQRQIYAKCTPIASSHAKTCFLRSQQLTKTVRSMMCFDSSTVFFLTSFSLFSNFFFFRRRVVRSIHTWCVLCDARNWFNTQTREKSETK